MPTRPKSKKRSWIKESKHKSWNNPYKAPDPFYHSTAWRRLRGRYIKQYPLCVECEKMGRIVAGYVVDHIKPITQGGERLKWENLQTLCESCHNRKSAKERRKK